MTFVRTNKVTPTGRAKSPGRVTRASLAVKRPAGAPLPLHLQCHPKALTRTSHNPGCTTSTMPWAGDYLFYRKCARARGIGYFTVRSWPIVPTDKYVLHIAGNPTFTCNDLNVAMGWKKAAEDYGLPVSLFINR